MGYALVSCAHLRRACAADAVCVACLRADQVAAAASHCAAVMGHPVSLLLRPTAHAPMQVEIPRMLWKSADPLVMLKWTAHR